MKNMYEIFEEFDKASNRDGKKEILLRNDSPALQFVLQGAFHPSIQFIFKERIPYTPLKDTIPGVSLQNMNHAMKLIYIWTEGSKQVNPTLRYDRKVKIFEQLLESLEPKESEVLMNMMLKELNVRNLTYKLVAESFPGLLPVNDQGRMPTSKEDE